MVAGTRRGWNAETALRWYLNMGFVLDAIRRACIADENDHRYDAGRLSNAWHRC